MKPDRRSPAIHDRRKADETNPHQDGVADAGDSNTIANLMPPLIITKVVSSSEESEQLREEEIPLPRDIAHLREKAVMAREEEVYIREDAAHEREQTTLRREEWATSREQEILDERAFLAAKQERDTNLKQVNEQLVIASVKLQIATEEIEKSKAEMTHLAHHDFLTDLPNRMQLYDRITQAIALAKRRQTKLAVLFMDLDRFKIVNDTLGHAVGDELLRSVAQRLTSAIRSSDTVSRHGGDEFILLLSEVSPMETFSLTVEKIHKLITAPYCIADNDLHIGATIGISIFPDDGEDTETLIRNADTAMYHAKESGRNKYQFFHREMHAREMERQGIESSLRQALYGRQFVLFYQAQFNLESGAITGVEALIRWHHPSRGLLLPAWFVPVAEDCGAIVTIGIWVLREACRQAQLWLEEGLTFNVISVNVSASQFENDNFLKDVRVVLQETGLAPNHLELELTETVLMKDIERTATILHELRSMGVRIAIDDFGTGYSSLNYLKKLTVDTIKIDRSFVHDISTGNDDILVNAIIGIGKSLRHQIIAEGVETAKQLAFLRENHCTAAQGFYLNAPMVAEEFVTTLKQGAL